MSLNITLKGKELIRKNAPSIYIRRGGQTVPITPKEWNELYPDRKVETMVEEYETYEAYETNITHNLAKMAREVGIYRIIWRADELEFCTAKDIIKDIEAGLEELKSKPDYYKKFDAFNGWGTYDQFIPWLERYLNALKEYPDAEIICS